MGDPACLLDSNILLRISQRGEPHYAIIRLALVTLRRFGTRLCYTSQTLGEFWNASTRRLNQNGFGLSIRETNAIAREFERDFEFLADSREVHDHWRGLLLAHQIK